MLKKSWFILLVIPLLAFKDVAETNPRFILERMVKTCYAVKSMKYTQQKTERINGDLKRQRSYIKYQKDPLSLYMRQESPKEGLEVLYVNGKNDNNALINPNGFPWVNVSLSPFGERMREGQHHTVFESGFYYFATIVEHLTKKYNKQTDGLLTYQGTVTFNNRLCHKIFVNNKNFEYVSHKVDIRQSLLTIAKHHFICEHMILELNENIDDYNDVEVGDVIIRPNDYAKTITLLVDVERHIPLKLIVHDDKGLYEQYEFLDVILNPEIDPEEFSKDYEEYGF